MERLLQATDIENVLEKLVGIEGGLAVNGGHDLKCPQGYHEVKEDH
jgi:hypothetical protein